MTTERSKALWGAWGAVLAICLMVGILGGIDYTTGHDHHYGAWTILIGAGVGGLGNLIGRAAA